MSIFKHISLFLLGIFTTTLLCAANELCDDSEVLGRTLANPANYYLQSAATQTNIEEKNLSLLLAANAYLQNQQITETEKILESFKNKNLSEAVHRQFNILSARKALLSHHPEEALALLQNIPNLQYDELRTLYRLRAHAYIQQEEFFASCRERMRLDRLLVEEPEKSKNLQYLWATLQKLEVNRLSQLKKNSDDPIELGWLDLVSCQKNSVELNEILNLFQTWRLKHPEHPGIYLLKTILPTLERSQKKPKNIALLLPKNQPLSANITEGFLAANRQDKAGNIVTIRHYDTHKNIDAALQNAIQNGADLIVGPLEKTDIDHLFQTYHYDIPIITLNYAHDLQNVDPRIYQLGLSPLDEAQQAARQSLQDKHFHAIIIAPANYWGHQIADAFAHTLQDQGGQITDRYFFLDNENMSVKIQKLLQTNLNHSETNNTKGLRREGIDVIFLVSTLQQAQKIIPLLKYHGALELPIFSTPLIYGGNESKEALQDIEGVYFADIPFLMKVENNPIKHTLTEWRYYALGFEAYRLSQMLPALSLLQFFSWQASIGTLTLDQQQRIQRSLTWMKIDHGKITTTNIPQTTRPTN